MPVRRRDMLSMAGCTLLARPAIGQARQAPGITDKEILIGQTMPYSGPGSSYAPIGFSQIAYFKKINDEQGGIRGRRIKVLSLDDGFSPPKTVEQTRRLVEQEQVAFIFQQLGTAPSTATRRYLNQKKVPQLFVASGATQFGDWETYPWTIGWQPSYQIEARIYARYILANQSDAKIAMINQNDDSGKDYAKGFRDGLGDQADRLISVTSYELTDSTVDSQVLQMRDAGANVLFAHSVPKFGAMIIRKTYDIGWKPLYIMTNTASSLSSGINPAGPEKAVGHLTAAYMKDPTDPSWTEDAGYKDWLAFMRQYQPQGDVADINNVYGYSAAQTLVPVLQQCGEDLSRANIMKQAASLDIQLPMFQPGIRFQTGAKDYYGIKRLRMQRFDGKAWRPFGEPLGA